MAGRSLSAEGRASGPVSLPSPRSPTRETDSGPPLSAHAREAPRGLIGAVVPPASAFGRHFPWGPAVSDFRRGCTWAHAAAVRLTLRSHGGWLRLGFRELRRREAGPWAYHGAGESADRRGQRARAAAGPGRGRGAEGGGGRRGPASQLRARVSPQRMTDKCFRKCIGKPGGSLDNSEQVNAGGRRGRGPGPGGEVSAHARGLTGRRDGAAARAQSAAGVGGRWPRSRPEPCALPVPRSASPCAWTATWTPGTPCPVPITRGCSGNEPTCDRDAPAGHPPALP